MLPSQSLQQMRTSQIQLLSSFCHIKVEILSMLVKPYDALAVEPLNQELEKLEEKMDGLYQQFLAKPGESASERKLRLKGVRVMHRTVIHCLINLMRELEWLLEWSIDEPLNQWEREILDKTIDSLMQILNCSLQLMMGYDSQAPQGQ